MMKPEGASRKLIRNLVQEPPPVNPAVFFEMSISGKVVGSMVMELFEDVVPKTVENFLALCTGKKTNVSYMGSRIHRILPGELCNGGVFRTKWKGTITGVQPFEQENFVKKHDRRGALSMSSVLSGSKMMSHGSGFNICFRAAPELDGKYVVFGQVIDGIDALDKIEVVPKERVTITGCGRYK